jgi:hypothetical protein
MGEQLSGAGPSPKVGCARSTRGPSRLGPRSAAKYPDRNGRSGEIRTPDPLLPKQVRYQAALRCARLAQVGEVGQIPPKKRTIGPGRSNLRPHRRLPASPKLWAILQPGCNHYPAFERFTSGHGSRAHLAQARLSVCNGPDPDVQVVRRLLNRSLLGQLHAARPPAAPSRRGEG